QPQPVPTTPSTTATATRTQGSAPRCKPKLSRGPRALPAGPSCAGSRGQRQPILRKAGREQQPEQPPALLVDLTPSLGLDLAPTPAATARQPHLCLGLILLVLFPRRVLTPYASGERLCDMQKNHRYVYVFLILLMILMGALLLLVEIHGS